MKRSILTTVAAWALAAGPAQAQQPAAAEPRWGVSGAGKQCILSRAADTPAGVTMAIRTYPWSGMIDLVLIGPRWPGGLRSPKAEVTLGFADPDATITHKVSFMPLPGAGQMLEAERLGEDFVVGVERSAKLTVQFQNAPLATISLPMGDKAIQALRRCERTKLVEMGADEALLDPASRPPQPAEDTSNWVNLREFLNLGFSNRTFRFFSVAQLLISPDGKIEKCSTLETMGAREVDKFVCDQLLRHAHFRPGYDKDGKPVRGVAVEPYDMTIESTLTVE